MKVADLNSVRLVIEATRGQHDSAEAALDALELRILEMTAGEWLSMSESLEKRVTDLEPDMETLLQRIGGKVEW